MKPCVTGISPREGSPGTKLTIRGENLGVSSSDVLHIFIGKMDVACSVQWISAKKLTIITSLGEGEMKIIVVTKSGGTGTCDVDYIQSISQNIGAQEEVSYWPPNEHKYHQMIISHARQSQARHMQSEMMEDIQNFGTDNNLPVNFALSDDELYKRCRERGSTTMTEPDFNPTLHLLKYYHGSSYEDLLKTLDTFEKTMAAEKIKEPVSIVKANLFSIFQCLDCLDSLKKKMDDEKTTKRSISGAFVENELHNTLESCKKVAHKMYEEVLRRRDYSDSARSAYAVMQRFQFLFNLPHSIRENIKKGEYSMAINDYLQARSHFGRSNIRLFQQVYKDVEQVISQFKERLFKEQLTATGLGGGPIKCEDAKVTVRLLKKLEVDYEPAWVCLESQKDWILSFVGKINTGSLHVAIQSQQHQLQHSVLQQPQQQQQQQQQNQQQQQQQQKNPVVEIMRQLNSIMTDWLREMWGLACYFVENDGDSQDIELLLTSVVCAYSSKVREIAASLTGASASAWLVYCLQQARQAVAAAGEGVAAAAADHQLQQQTSSTTSSPTTATNTAAALPLSHLPTTARDSLSRMLLEVRCRAISALLSRAQNDVTALRFKENWVATEISDECGAVTRLPVQYRAIMLASLADIERVMNSRHPLELELDAERKRRSRSKNDRNSYDDELPSTNQVDPETSTLQGIVNAMNAYIECTRGILSKITPVMTSSQDEDISNSTLITNSNDDSSGSQSTMNVTRLLLLMANNVYQCQKNVNPALIQYIRKSLGEIQSENGRDWIMKRVNPGFEELHEELVKEYIRLKVNVGFGGNSLEKAITNALFRYKSCYGLTVSVSAVTGSTYGRSGSSSSSLVSGAVCSLAAQVHSETMLVSPHLTTRSLPLVLLTGNVLGCMRSHMTELKSSNISDGLPRWSIVRFATDLAVLDELVRSAGTTAITSSDTATVNDWRELRSLLNLTRNDIQLSSEEQVIVKAAVKKDTEKISLLISGLRIQQ